MRKILIMTLTATTLGAGIASAATTITTTFPVTATVASTCSASAAALGFGTYTPGAGALTSNTTISVKCTKNTAFTIALNAGLPANGGSFALRHMGSGANTLEYNLFTTAALAAVFGDGSPGTSTMPGTGSGVATAVTQTVYGQLPDSANNQAAVPGAYSDTITVSVTY